MTNSVGSIEEQSELRSQMVFPHFASGTVVKGFGRGSKQLGIPTANYPESVVEHLPEAFHNGVYYGLAQVDTGPVYPMVMSVGNNPYYNNEKRTMVSVGISRLLPFRQKKLIQFVWVHTQESFHKLRSEQDFSLGAVEDPKWILIRTAIIQTGYSPDGTRY
jgi:FAD synthase